MDPVQRSTYEAVAKVASEKQVPFIIIGASARDLVMHHGYGAPIQRATRDIDLAVQLPDWESFESIRDSLVAEGYERTGIPHRLRDAQGTPLDIIPFGPLEHEHSKIAWPPKGEVEMGVMGFQEALDQAIHVVVEGEPELILPVASPVGLGLLKLIAWFERDLQTRSKDANDLAFLAANYENIPGVMELMYDAHLDILENYDWDTRLSGAHILGLHVAEIASSTTQSSIKNILSEDSVELMEKEARGYSREGEFSVLAALSAGFLSK